MHKRTKSLAEKYKDEDMDKKAFLQETYNSAFKDELEKISAKQCPGSKIKSKGKGRGLGVGKTKGPIGVPIGEKKFGKGRLFNIEELRELGKKI